MLDFIVFLKISIICSAIFAVSSTNPILAILYLIFTILNITILLLYLGLDFLAFLLIIVYIGAVAVLFLFCVMLINIHILDLEINEIFYTFLLRNLFLFWLVFFVNNFFMFNNTNILINLLQNNNELMINLFVYNYYLYTNIELLGHVLYTEYLFIFILCALILLITLIVVIFLSVKNNKTIASLNLREST